MIRTITTSEVRAREVIKFLPGYELDCISMRVHVPSGIQSALRVQPIRV